MEKNKPTCFVIQEFDDGRMFDKRYIETIEPALIDAEVEPKRADKILGLQPVIQKIETAIQQASICVAEVSTDNPNVWLELGYALAINKPVVILCDKKIRNRLPFDIQHRPVILYNTDSKSGYDELERRIKEEVKGQIELDNNVASAPTIKGGGDELEDLKDYEVAILTVLLASWPRNSDGVSYWELEMTLKSTQHNDLALGLGINNLINKELIEKSMQWEGTENEAFTYRITPNGIIWLDKRKDKLELAVCRTWAPRLFLQTIIQACSSRQEALAANINI